MMVVDHFHLDVKQWPYITFHPDYWTINRKIPNTDVLIVTRCKDPKAGIWKITSMDEFTRLAFDLDAECLYLVREALVSLGGCQLLTINDYESVVDALRSLSKTDYEYAEYLKTCLDSSFGEEEENECVSGDSHQ